MNQYKDITLVIAILLWAAIFVAGIVLKFKMIGFIIIPLACIMTVVALILTIICYVNNGKGENINVKKNYKKA